MNSDNTDAASSQPEHAEEANVTAAPSLAGEPSVVSEKIPATAVDVESGVVLGGFQFWMIFVSLIVTVFLSALELTSVATTLPTIIQDLHGTEFAWVGSAYAIGEAAVLPLIGGMAEIFGRRPMVIISIAIFTLGSGICGGAKSMTMLIGGRTVQGIGGGGILTLTEIVVADLVPLAKRGNYLGFIAGTWGVAAAIGPPIGGAFAQSNWRWLFWLNLPFCGVALVLVTFFMNLKTPQDDFKSKMKRMDWIGNALVIAATTSSIVALTWAGIEYPWSSVQVLVPLILGLVGLAAFLVYEAIWAKDPVVPFTLISNRTSLMGYLQVFEQGVVACVIIFYLPVYFQGALGQSPLHSGTSIFGISFTIPPFAMIAGITMATFKIYKPQHHIAWILCCIGFGLLTMLDDNTPKGKWVGYQLIPGVGVGILYLVPTFPVLSPLPISETAHALAFFVFARTYSLSWGITIGSTILQNQLKKRLPPALLAQFPQGAEISYQIIPKISSLPEPLRTEVKHAFARSMRIIWFVMLGFSIAGFFTSLFMDEVPMHDQTDASWGMEDDGKKPIGDVEKEGVQALT